MSDDELRLIRERHRSTDTTHAMRSGCSDYACYCHFDVPKLLDEIDRLKAALATPPQTQTSAPAAATPAADR